MSSNDLFLLHQKQSRRRLCIATLALFAVFVLYASQLVKIQAVQADELAQTGFAKRQREVTVPAMRGAITDVNGIALATTVPAFNLTIDQTRIVDHKATAKQLAPILGIYHKLILERLSGDQKFVYLARSVTPQIWDRVAKLKLGGIY